jgi:DNA repair protein RAD57
MGVCWRKVGLIFFLFFIHSSSYVSFSSLKLMHLFSSSSGKTQLALQLSLLVQLPPTLGGISGAACYLTTQTELETRRLVILLDTHPLLSTSVCSMQDIQTVRAATIPLLQKVLRDVLPTLIRARIEDASKKPVRLLVIDSIADLFPYVERTTTATLAERSRGLTEVSMVLHRIAREFQIAVVVLNKVTDVFSGSRGADGVDMGAPGDLLYWDQSRWFNRADSIHEERSKEAALGLVWANQLNVRVMFTRTGRRRYLDEDAVGSGTVKRRRSEGGSTKQGTLQTSGGVPPKQDTVTATLLRRMTVVFSSTSVAPASVDFVITEEGVSAPVELQTVGVPSSVVARPPVSAAAAATGGHLTDMVAPLDVGSAEVSLDPSPDNDVEDDSEWGPWLEEDDKLYEDLNLIVP